VLFGKSKQPGNQPHAPGWVRNRIYYTNPNTNNAESRTWDGHRFCERGVHSLNDPSIYFILWTGEDAPANASPSDIQAHKDTCSQDARYGYDPAFTCNCSLAIDLARPGVDQNIKVVLPENYAKVFHPRTNGHTALGRMNNAAMLQWRPRERGYPACSGTDPIPDVSYNITDLVNITDTVDPSAGLSCTPSSDTNAPTAPAATSPAPTATSGAGFTGGTCLIYVQEKLTCGSDDENLDAYVELKDSTGKTIGTSGDPSALGPDIGAKHPYDLKSSLPHPITITGEHAGDYVQFNYNGLQWQSREKKDGDKPYCDTGPWSENLGCIDGTKGVPTYVISVCSLLICWRLL
jgi:hypothetical protein